jgi:hypothetical protein
LVIEDVLLKGMMRETRRLLGAPLLKGSALTVRFYEWGSPEELEGSYQQTSEIAERFKHKNLVI